MLGLGSSIQKRVHYIEAIEQRAEFKLNMEIPEYFAELSIRMSEILADSGAGKDTVIERRRTYLWRECMMKIAYQCGGHNFECFHFGSQSEGTTIPGLQSDIDFLYSANDVNIMKVWEDWEAGMWNFLMLQDDTTLPQQVLLQDFRRDRPEPETRLINSNFVRNDSGQILFSAELVKQACEYSYTKFGKVTKIGPSVSHLPNWDIVAACQVRKPLNEIQHWIRRCRGRHWPPAQLLDAARVAPCFLVPAGHPDSDYKREEWRLSPNLIERMLMFSFNMTQLKCYIILKLINKSLFANIVENSITSFHCKTIMFYTIEKTDPSLWLEHNLMFLLRLCLNVLRKWLRFGKLPHFIIEGVNLFDGKLSKVQQRRLLVYIDSMIRNNLQDVFFIGIDNIGNRLQAYGVRQIVLTGVIRRVCLRNRISLLLKFECLGRFHKALITVMDIMHSSHTKFGKVIKCVLSHAFENSKNVILKTVALEFVKHLYLLQNSIQSSNCLRSRNVIDSEVISSLQYSLNTDIASSRLKMASILYCSGHIHAAVRVLENVERRYHSKVKTVCGERSVKGERAVQVFDNMLSGNSGKGFSEPPFAFCVKFLRKELFCAPFILLFEMNRSITEEEVAQRSNNEKYWMNRAEVDARPFLHYLQYLTYGALGERDKQRHALRVLESYICDIRNRINIYHGETAQNLLGHCYEMEGKYNGALYYYRNSLLGCGTNNAANWHVRRVLRLLSG